MAAIPALHPSHNYHPFLQKANGNLTNFAIIFTVIHRIEMSACKNISGIVEIKPAIFNSLGAFIGVAGNFYKIIVDALIIYVQILLIAGLAIKKTQCQVFLHLAGLLLAGKCKAKKTARKGGFYRTKTFC